MTNFEPDPDRGLPEAALWRTSNAPWGVVRHVIFTAEFAFVLDDTTGVDVEVELKVYRRRADGWESIFDLVDVGYPEVGDTHPGWAGGYAWIFGRVAPRAAVVVRYLAKDHEVRADDQGMWAFIREVTLDEDDTWYYNQPALMD